MGERTFQVRGQPHTHSFVLTGDVVVILAEASDGRFLLVRQYRASLDRQTVEFPAGHCEPGESPEAAAGRELEEETGHRCARLRFLFKFEPAPGCTDEVIHAFWADGLEPTATSFDPGEDIEILRWSPNEIDAAAREGRLTDGKTLLLWLARKAGFTVRGQ